MWRFGLYAAGARKILDSKDLASNEVHGKEPTDIRTDIERDATIFDLQRDERNQERKKDSETTWRCTSQ